MPIAFDSSSHGTDNTPNSSPASISHTCTGSNLVLCTGFYTANATSITTSVTYAGVSMSQAITNAGHPTGETTEMWTLAGPSTGANNIVITCSADKSIEYCSTSYTGAPGGLDATATASSAGTNSFAGSITTVADNAWYIMISRNNAEVYGAGAGTTIRASQGATSICDGNAAKTPAGSATLTLTATVSPQHGACLVSISPTATATVRLLMLLGVGS